MPRATKPKPLPPIDALREYLSYDPGTGVVRWQRSISSRAVVGAEADCSMTRRGASGNDYRFIDVAGH